jgi:hydroxymethylpyrimidine/phosphomethylpyrimidine kinase
MNPIHPDSPPCVLTVAGSDSGGGAGIQADLKTFMMQGTYGLSVVTALTAQNTTAVTAIEAPSPGFAAAQLDAVLSDFPIRAAKTGMLFSAPIIETVAGRLAGTGFPLVVDPVCVSQSGARLLESQAVDALRERLIPLAALVTPNLPEAMELTGVAVTGPDTAGQAARRILDMKDAHGRGPKAVLVKGGHAGLGAATVTDLLVFADGREVRIDRPRLATKNTHGTGCTLSAAIAAHLALGADLETAVARARDYLHLCLRAAYDLGAGNGPPHHLAPYLRTRARLFVLDALRQAARRLVAMPGLASLVPEVSMNLALAAPWPAAVGDVAAFAGRITRGRDGSVYIPAGPAFGASSHMAKVVLAASAVVPAVACAVNVRYNERTLAALSRAGLVAAWFDRAKEPQEVKAREGSSLEWGTHAALAAHPDPASVDAVCDPGESGKEPMIRLLGRDADDVLAKLELILAAL